MDKNKILVKRVDDYFCGKCTILIKLMDEQFLTIEPVMDKAC